MVVNIAIVEHFADFPKAPVSSVAENAHMVLVACLLATTLFRRYVMEKVLPKIPGLSFDELDSRTQKSFLNSIMHLIVRVAAVFSVIRAFIKILTNQADFATTFSSEGPTFGTMLMVSMIVLCSVYIHETIYREEMSIITLVHHIGTVAIGAYAILLSLEWKTEIYTQAYFAFCCLFGFFDVITKFFVTLSFVIC
jgi:hypothetical protein